MNLSLPDNFEAVQIITDFAEGNSDALMARLEIMSPVLSALEHDYWLEELERSPVRKMPHNSVDQVSANFNNACRYGQGEAAGNHRGTTRPNS